uniref:Titin n=1 Tax=Salarias fasciatus TaxID=181472 RepID=A0A672I7V4_SALFA
MLRTLPVLVNVARPVRLWQTSEPAFDVDSDIRKVMIVKHGAAFTLNVPFRGNPVPSATWAKEGVDLKVRGTIESTETSTSLTLDKSTRYDSGEYCVTIESPLGKAVPGPPVGPVEIGEVGETTVCLKWAPPEYDGGSPVTNYVILKRETSTPTWSEVSTNVARSSFKVTKLTKGEEYQFRVKAVNRYGMSDHIDSKPVMIKLPYSKSDDSPSVPSPPGSPEILASGKDFATIEWMKPESDGGSPLIHYLVERHERKSARWVKVNRDGAHLDTTLKVTGLTEGNIYQFRVTAINKAGESEPSEVSLYVVCRMSSDGRNHSLSIMTDQQEDEGEYTCKAINDAGEAETTGVLVLEAAPSFHPDYQLKETYYAGLGTTLRIHAVYIGLVDTMKDEEGQYMFHAGEKTSSATLTVSAITRPLQDVTVAESQTAVLECEVANAEAEGRWLKEGQVVDFNENVVSEVDGAVRRLVIVITRPQDVAEYTYQVANSKTSANLRVEGMYLSAEPRL